MKTHLLKFLLLAILFISCDSSTSEIETTDDTNTDDIIDNTPTVSTKPNILLIIADDVSKDAIPNYTEGSTKANMNNLQSLMSTGITFDNVWSYAVCSPTRASIITGKYGLNTGVIQVGDQISTTETSLQQYVNSIDANDYATAIFGKWHISSNNEDSKTMGVDYFAGIRSGGVQDYYNWELIENGVNSTSTEYITSKLTDLAIDWKNEQTKPWFLWLGIIAQPRLFNLLLKILHSQEN